MTKRLYVVKWEDGDFSIVAAVDRDDALDVLDEIGSPEPEEVRRLSRGSMKLGPRWTLALNFRWHPELKAFVLIHRDDVAAWGAPSPTAFAATSTLLETLYPERAEALCPPDEEALDEPAHPETARNGGDE